MTANKIPPGNTKPVDDVSGIETTGHEWDGIKELNNPLPRWWLWCLYLTIIWGIGYTIAYPAWPLINGATSGLLGYSTRGEVERDIAQFNASNAELEQKLSTVEFAAMGEDEALYHYAVSSGAAVFRNNCSQCHGSGAAGAKGYPNLLDDDWLWGGTFDDIVLTVRHGIRNDTDDDARFSQMPAYGDILEADEIDALVETVRGLAGEEHDATLAAAGAETYADNCAACHGEQGKGDREQGAPNLTDAIWLYGGDRATLHDTITYARFGVMPAWGPRLSDAQVNAVSAYVHQLGGGERATPE